MISIILKNLQPLSLVTNFGVTIPPKLGNSIWVSSFVLRKNRSHLGLYSSQAWEVWRMALLLGHYVMET
jgi:hypothetical protein